MDGPLRFIYLDTNVYELYIGENASWFVQQDMREDITMSALDFWHAETLTQYNVVIITRQFKYSNFPYICLR